MLRYILKRFLWLIPVILGVSFLIFVLMDMAPGDMVDAIAASDMSEEDIAALKSYYNLDRSVFYRYGLYLKNLLHGSLGDSIQYQRPVMEVFLQLLPATLKLAFWAMVVTIVLAIPLGIFSALYADTIVDNISAVLALLGLSMPNFWLGLMLVVFFSLKLGWFPTTGDLDGWRSLVLPAITLGTGHVASLARVTRSATLDVLKMDYLNTARSKGLPERVVILKHAFRNALIPIVTVIGTQLAGMMGGAVLTETVFGWPGVGRAVVYALNQRDTALATGFVVMETILLSLVLLIVDLLYTLIDPRIKAQFKGNPLFKRNARRQAS